MEGVVKSEKRRLLVSAKGLERWIEEQAEKGWYA